MYSTFDDVPAYKATALALEQSPAFDDAVMAFASDLRGFYSNYRDAAPIFSDVGQLAIVSSLIVLPSPVAEADICRLLGAGALASRRRIGNHIVKLERLGFVHRAGAADRRRRPVAPTPKLEALLNRWVRALSGAAASLCGGDRAALERTDLARFYLQQVMASHQKGFSAFADVPAIGRLAALSRGHAFVLELLRAAVQSQSLEIRFSRREFAKLYGVSRTHVIDLLAECERARLITQSRARTLLLSPIFISDARRWAAINFALAAAALQGRLLTAL
ncbi:MAG: hypothetical protein J0L81_01065 [Caulobacterales bacterium]|nr:hypothetical protein [Caulobacterales bacterium]